MNRANKAPRQRRARFADLADEIVAGDVATRIEAEKIAPRARKLRIALGLKDDVQNISHN